MPLANISQPDILPITPLLRLRKVEEGVYEGAHFSALDWYQDLDLVYMVDGVRKPYSEDMLGRMYRYLARHGELYWIEAKSPGKDASFVPIGDVTLCVDDLPIVIGNPAYRGKGLGRQVLQALVRRAEALGWQELGVKEIYSFNLPSQRCFQSVGFTPLYPTMKGMRYRKLLGKQGLEGNNLAGQEAQIKTSKANARQASPEDPADNPAPEGARSGRAKYFMTKDQVVDHDVFEWARPSEVEAFWGEDSLYLAEDDFVDVQGEKLFQEALPAGTFQYYGPSKIDHQAWDQLKKIAACHYPQALLLLQEADPWVQACLAEYSHFMIYGP